MASVSADDIVDAVALSRARRSHTIVRSEPAMDGGDGRARAAVALRRIRERYPREFPQRPPLGMSARHVGADVAYELSSRTAVRRSPDGIPRLESNPRLHPYHARGLGDHHGVYHEMSRGDGAIAGTLAIIVREIVRAHYVVTVDDDATDDERAAASLVERALGLGQWRRTGGWLRGGFRTLLGHALQAPVYGFSATELSFDVRRWQGRAVIVPVRADWRAPWGVERWIWQGDDLVAMGQLVQSPGVTLGLERRTIPVDRLLLFTHNYVDGNPEGTSMLRPCWIAWRAKKDTILRHQVAEDKLFGGVAILEEGGTPEGGPYPWCTEQDEETLFEAFSLWRENALDLLKKPYGYELSIQYPGFQIPSKIEELKWYDHQIFLTGLAALLGLDAAGAASKGLSDGLAAVLYNALHAHAVSICDTINGLEGMPWTGLVRAICHANFRVDESFRYPVVEPRGIQHQDIRGYVDAITKAYQFRLATPMIEDQLDFRRQAGLPEVSRERLEALNALLSGRAEGTQISQRDTQAPVEPPSAGEGAGGSGRPEGSDVESEDG